MRSVLKQHRDAWLDVRAINRYKLVVRQATEHASAEPSGHARLANLAAEAILKTLAIYRLAFGQPRQVELIDHLLKKDFTPEEVALIREKLMINLSPISYAHTG